MLKEEFQKDFWFEEESYYYLALDKNKNPRKTVSSNPGHLFFTGILSAQVLPRIVKRLFQSDLFTQSKYFIDPVFSNLSLDNSGNVIFDLEFTVDPSFVNYKNMLLRVNDNFFNDVLN